MRIAQVSPLFESVPPKLYGGTERIVSYLTEALVELGHEVTLFASGDSRSLADLRPPCPRALRLDPDCHDQMAHHTLMFEMVMQMAHGFDIIHFHTEALHFPLARRMAAPNVTTLHGRLDLLDYVRLFREFEELPFTSISRSQRKPLAWVNWMDCVYHGLPRHLFRLNEEPDEYLAFVGRVSPEKRVDRAVEIARRSGLRLKIAAKIDMTDREYVERLTPLFSEPFVEFVGEIGDAEKEDFIGNAKALLFPIDWPEPFGLVMLEAMAVGTPVIAWRNGAVPEVIRDGVTGFVVDSLDQAVEAVQRLPEIRRATCREEFEARFTADVMAQNYVRVYEKVLAQRGHLVRPKRSFMRDRAQEITT